MAAPENVNRNGKAWLISDAKLTAILKDIAENRPNVVEDSTLGIEEISEINGTVFTSVIPDPPAAAGTYVLGVTTKAPAGPGQKRKIKYAWLPTTNCGGEEE